MQVKFDDRSTYLDVLRIMASVAVVLIHTIGGGYYHGYMSRIWLWTTLFNANARWSVPMFVMISGALMLDPNVILKEKLRLKKSILKMSSYFLIWSTVYAIFWHLQSGADVLVTFIQGSHLYFLYIIIGVYLIVPFLGLIFKEAKLTRYFLLLWFIFTFAIPRIQYYISLVFENAKWTEVSQALQWSEDIMNMHFPVGYSGYFLIGGGTEQTENSFGNGD